ncbi:drug resistance transporter, EmrB/QacA subfamily [Amycolatopsis xylanica]|uniref:Drug resistance transporter, EmrB/QacA subfamily n=1 Tax=Amycolatopsis xylanica TaxID=589385 RepID=A0A1H2V1H0_9PSEU|nr:MFS transporter [Amycolatopsis xylanica]SDW62202.1 drug resistance transporter, EmrB/QacA subfamily [Amycolatopsis xylanica]
MTSTVTQTRPRFVLAAAVTAQTLVLLDNTILNIAVDVLSDPVRGIGASASELAWAVSTYPLMFAALIFTGGALSDRFGPRATLVSGLTVLALASVFAAVSRDPALLVVARGVMGIGGALVTPATLAIATLGVPPERRARAVATWTSASGVAVAIGPVLGGVLLDRFWWGSVFLVNVPIAAVCVIGALSFVPKLSISDKRPLDPAGLILSMLGLGGLVFGIIEGGRAGWTDPLALTTVLTGLALIVAFALVQLRSRHPSFDVRLFTRPRFAGGALGLLLSFAGLAGQLFYCAFYLQGVHGLSPAQAGLVMTGAAVGIVAGNQLSPRAAAALSTRWTALAGLLLATATYAAFVLFDAHTPLVYLVLLLVAQGLGAGLAVPPVTSEMLAVLPAGRTGAGAAISAAARPLGSTLGVAALGSLLAAAYSTAIAPSLAGLPGTAREQAAASAEGARAVGQALGRPDLISAADNAYLRAMDLTAIVTAVVSLLGCMIIVRCFRRED